MSVYTQPAPVRESICVTVRKKGLSAWLWDLRAYKDGAFTPSTVVQPRADSPAAPVPCDGITQACTVAAAQALRLHGAAQERPTSVVGRTTALCRLRCRVRTADGAQAARASACVPCLQEPCRVPRPVVPLTAADGVRGARGSLHRPPVGRVCRPRRSPTRGSFQACSPTPWCS